MTYNVNVRGTGYRLAIDRRGDAWNCELDGVPIELDVRLISEDVISLISHGKSYEIKRDEVGKQTRLWIENVPYIVNLSDPRSFTASSRKQNLTGTATLLASMPGRVLRVLVAETQQVEAGQGLLVVEAMKMQNEIKAPSKGIVRQVVAEGSYVNAGDTLAIVE